jgi:uracil-DNA glycosylase family 4
MPSPYADSVKQSQYQTLVNDRQACRACAAIGLTNPSECAGGIYDNLDHIGPWTQWQNNLDADLMVIGQDWGGVEYYLENEGIEQDDNETNKRLVELLDAIDIKINLPVHTSGNRPLYFTNSALCLRPGRLTGPINSKWFSNCGPTFLRRQIELVSPTVIVTLGYQAYRAVFESFGLKPALRMGDAVTHDLETVGLGSVVVPVFHCGKNGQRSRSLRDQKEDWKRVQQALQDRA